MKYGCILRFFVVKYKKRNADRIFYGKGITYMLFIKQGISDDIARCCAMCEHSMKLDFKGQYLCKYRNRIAETEADDVCKHFEPDLLKIEPKPRKKYKYEEI